MASTGATKNVLCECIIQLLHSLDLRKLNQKFSFDGADFTAAGSSKCDHQFAGLANYKGSALTTGSYNAECSNRTEVYNFDTDQWTDAPDFPFES